MIHFITVGILESDGIPEQLNVLLEIISTQLLKAIETRSDTDEPAAKKLPSQLLQLFVMVSQHLPANSPDCDKVISYSHFAIIL